MSSHHVVREKQEPALLVLSLENFLHEYLGQLLEWSPTVIATSGSFEKLISDGIKVDWLIGNADTIETQGDVKIIYSKKSDDLATALEILIKEGYPSVNIISDKLYPEIFNSYFKEITMVLFTGNEKIFAVKSGYEKWLPKGEVIKILQIPDSLKTGNLRQISANELLVETDGIIKIEFDGPYLLISEFLEPLLS